MSWPASSPRSRATCRVRRPIRQPRWAPSSRARSSTRSCRTSRSGVGRARRSRTAAACPTIHASRAASSSSRPCSPRSTQSMRIAREEIFGPVLSVLRWRRRGRAVARRQCGRVRPVVLDLDARPVHGASRRGARRGGLRVGQPHRRSTSSACRSAATSSPGMGREESFDELLSYTQIKNVHIAL